VIKIGNSPGVILPKEALARLGVTIGDSLSVTETPGAIVTFLALAAGETSVEILTERFCAHIEPR